MKQAKKVLWMIGKAFRHCFKQIFVVILIFLLFTMLSLSLNILNKNIINELSKNMGLGTISSIFIGLVVAYMILYFLNMATGFLAAFCNNFLRYDVDLLFHKIFMYKSNNTNQDKFFESSFMEKYSFVSGNTNKASSYILDLLNLIFGRISMVIGSITLFAVYEPLLIIYVAVVAIVSGLVASYTAKKRYDLSKKQIKEQRFHDYYKSLLTNKVSARELRIYKFKEYIYNKWQKSYDILRKERLDLSLKENTLNNISIIIKYLFRVISIGVLLYGVYYQRYDIGVFAMLFGLIESTSSQINAFMYTVMSGIFNDIKYFTDYYDYVNPISSEEIKIIKNLKMENDLTLKYGDFETLKLENVSYAYPNSESKALDDISITINKGEIISILGYNGSGKTTLSKLINGSLEKQGGMITLNGNEYTRENKADVFKYFGMAPQEFSRFSLPVRDLVGLGFIEKLNDDEELALAYKKAGMNQFLNKYSKGDKTILGKEYDEEGVDLSGGEWQRLIIASAYMGSHEILIMDEPTASIDPLKEMELIINFRENLKGKTAVLISHRIGFARLADRIVMMEGGRITETGTHEELLAQNGYYSRLFNEQKKLYEEEALI